MKLLTTKTDLPKKKQKTIQQITYPGCGCKLMGPSPMPQDCPTHGPAVIQVEVDKVEIPVVIVLDESGSMAMCQNQTIEGYNEYINGLRKDGKPYLVTLSKFDSCPNEPTCRVQYSNLDISNVPALTTQTYQPRGGTPLYDAIGTTVKAVEGEVGDKPVLFIIISDGANNSSQTYTSDQIKEMIKQKESQGWTFIYLGANQDAWAQSQTFGVAASNAASFTTANIASTMNRMSAASVKYANARRSSYVTGARGQSLCSNAFYQETGTSLSDLGGATLGDVKSTIARANAQKMHSNSTPEERFQRASKAGKARGKKQE